MTFVRVDLTVVEILLEMCHDNGLRSISVVFCILLLLWVFILFYYYYFYFLVKQLAQTLLTKLTNLPFLAGGTFSMIKALN